MRYLFIMALFVLPLIACDGGGNGSEDDGTRLMNDIERTVWNLTVVCFDRSGVEPFGSVEYAKPRIKVLEAPCNSPSLTGCPRVNENVVEFNINDYYDDENTTPLNVEQFVRHFKHIILFQATGAADFDEDGPWYDGEPPCTNVGFNARNLCALSSVDCENPLAPFDEP